MLRLQLDKELAKARDIASLVAAKGNLVTLRSGLLSKVLINRYGPIRDFCSCLANALAAKRE